MLDDRASLTTGRPAYITVTMLASGERGLPDGVMEWQWVKQHGLKALVWGALAFAAWAVYDNWSQKQEGQRREAEQASIGFDASATADMWWEAQKGCHLIGITDLAACAKHEGPLTQDRAASIVAALAVKMREEYEAKCRKYHPAEYCYNLLNRAFHLSQREDAQAKR